ncbi:NIPSNAP family protein [Pseudomonas putida S11]|nr:NIPSNAP family protein [Pseudomonas putida S11]
MYYELRTYTLDPLKMADWLSLYQSHALEVQSEHLGNLVGFFTSEFGEVNQVVHIWGVCQPRRTHGTPRSHGSGPPLGRVLKAQSRAGRGAALAVANAAAHRFFAAAVKLKPSSNA